MCRVKSIKIITDVHLSEEKFAPLIMSLKICFKIFFAIFITFCLPPKKYIKNLTTQKALLEKKIIFKHPFAFYCRS